MICTRKKDGCHQKQRLEAKNSSLFLSEGKSFFFFLDATTHLYKRSCPSVRRSVGPSVHPKRVEFLRNKTSGVNLNNMASWTGNYAIRKTIQIQIREQIARTHLMSELCQTFFLLYSNFGEGKEKKVRNFRPKSPRRGTFPQISALSLKSGRTYENWTEARKTTFFLHLCASQMGRGKDGINSTFVGRFHDSRRYKGIFYTHNPLTSTFCC